MIKYDLTTEGGGLFNHLIQFYAYAICQQLIIEKKEALFKTLKIIYVI